MQPVLRNEIVDYVTYEEQRDGVRAKVLAIKAPRRVHAGAHVTFLFENRDTIRYQVQEMMRAERMVREADIVHELETYNELLGGPGSLGATVLIEIEDPKERDRLLRAWTALPGHLYLQLEDGTKVRAEFDRRQVGDERLSSVQYVKFHVSGAVPVAAGCDLPGVDAATPLSAEQRRALAEDLSA